jgi:hypothetical protein
MSLEVLQRVYGNTRQIFRNGRRKFEYLRRFCANDARKWSEWQEHFADWQRLWSAPKTNKHLCMTPKERASLEGMSSSFPVWRGVGFRGRIKGLSWTLDREKAVWFARRFRHRGSGKLIHAQIERDNVHAFFQGRREAEVVASDVEVLKIENLKGDNLPMV